MMRTIFLKYSVLVLELVDTDVLALALAACTYRKAINYKIADFLVINKLE